MIHSAFGWMYERYGYRKVKQKYLAQIEELFNKELLLKGFEGNGSLFFSHFLKPRLIKKSLNDLPFFEKFLSQASEIEFFIKAFAAYEKQPSLKEASNPQKALSAAQLKNIYNLNGRLSLLPLKLAQKHPEIAFFSEKEYTSISEAFHLVR